MISTRIIAMLYQIGSTLPILTIENPKSKIENFDHRKSNHLNAKNNTTTPSTTYTTYV